MQADGLTLTQISGRLARQFGVPSALLPMCDAPAPTAVLTDRGEMPFQEYFVKQRCAPAVYGFRYGAETGQPITAEIHSALTDPDLEGIILCPSNPYLSIAPILAVNGLRELLARVDVPVVAVSPIIGGSAVKGPAAKIMRELGLPVSPLAIARHYRDFLDVMLIDESDSSILAARETEDPMFEAAPILMRTLDERRALAEACLKLLSRLHRGSRART
jgi:LPPG:FO 2-phospho-L-lactate transferase